MKPSPAQRILFFPLGVFLRVLGLLPLSVLYLPASLMAWLARDVFRYRRRIVHENIRDSFPAMGDGERARIERRFYRHLADYIVETIKLPVMGRIALMHRMRFRGTGLIDKIAESGRDIVIYTSHFGNWEWITSMGLWCKCWPQTKFSHVYRPLRQRWFNRWFLRARSRFNVSIPMRSVFRQLLTWRRRDQRWVCGFLSDQKPSHAGRVYTVPFLGRATPFIGGTEELACKLNAVVLYFDTTVDGRGRYTCTVRMLSEHPREEEPGAITRRYAATLEAQIRRTPEAYLWSHNRWRLPKPKKCHSDATAH